VVGVIASLGLFLAREVFVAAGSPGGIDLFAIAVAAGATVALVRLRVEAHWAVLAGAVLGLARWAIGI
jgi:hypothetical protein